VKNLHDGNTSQPGAIDQRLYLFKEERVVSLAPVRTVAERFLRIDDN
jgi:hypothetical protein